MYVITNSEDKEKVIFLSYLDRGVVDEVYCEPRDFKSLHLVCSIDDCNFRKIDIIRAAGLIYKGIWPRDENGNPLGQFVEN